jgi:hypothetical protein
VDARGISKQRAGGTLRKKSSEQEFLLLFKQE